MPRDVVRDMRRELAEKIGIKWVDIGQKTPSELKRLKPSIYNYDLKYGSRVIAGSENVLDAIPEMDSRELPLREGEILFFTRLWTLLGSLDRGGFSVPRSSEESRFFRNQMAKCVLASVDARLLQCGCYHTSYVARVERLSELPSTDNEFSDLSAWALGEKLAPTAPEMGPEEVRELYMRVHRVFFLNMYSILSRYYRRDLCGPEMIEWHLKWGLAGLIGRLGRLAVRRNCDYERRMAVNLAQLYVAAAFSHGQILRRYLNKGLDYARSLDESTGDSDSWDDARVRVAELRMEFA